MKLRKKYDVINNFKKYCCTLNDYNKTSNAEYSVRSLYRNLNFQIY